MKATVHIRPERGAVDRLLRDLRPKLHRYTSRMTGSVVDGEDVLQDALVKAIEALPGAETVANLEGWIFRIAHNTALDFLRRRTRREAAHGDGDPEMAVDPVDEVQGRQIAAASLRTFMRLPVTQRSSVILKDVLGHSLAEIGDVMQASIPAVKAALHKGRARLRELSAEPDDLPPPAMSPEERARLTAYVDRFNARDFEAIRAMLAEEVRLELVSAQRMEGRREVARYFGNYDSKHDWFLAPGFVDGRPAILVSDPRSITEMPANYFILLEWSAGKVVGIRDFRYAQYATEGAELVLEGGTS